MPALDDRDEVVANRLLGLALLASGCLIVLGAAVSLAPFAVGLGVVAAGLVAILGARWKTRLRPVAIGLLLGGFTAVMPERAAGAESGLTAGIFGVCALVSTLPLIRALSRWSAARTDPYVEALGRKLGYAIASILSRLTPGS